ncbi:fimbrial protein [Leminorella grimontii]|nr:fimbrial protein [Leminorella grimontii]KFC94413.1 hypothetical protein GLGR_2760 [Leminorella grimontii ATCC 33999 = DSM 5078]VFS54626.1 P pilus assembly protein, pilin FimA [Leminorella grimontii]
MFIQWKKITLSNMIAGIFCFSISFATQALTFTYYPTWGSGGGVAGTCTFTLPEQAPLSIPRTLIVNNSLPNGTELFSWNYNEFIPNISGSCSANGSNTRSSSARFFFMPAGSVGGTAMTSGAFKTNIPGIGIKFYYTYTATGMSAYQSATSSSTTRITTEDGWKIGVTPLNIEYSMKNDTSIGVWFTTDYRMTPPPTTYFYSYNANNAAYSVRAALVKTGSITYTSTPLSLPQAATFGTPDAGGYTPIPTVLGGGGITIIPPTCRLHTPEDYVVNMGEWTNKAQRPAYSTPKGFNINLECSGRPDNVYFRFEDTGISPGGNKNVSLYDGSGNKIDGLEIEMQYGGSRIDVDNTTITSVGPHGATKTNTQDFSFNSQSSVGFSARYVQRNNIQKAGTPYFGPVTGMVNMYVIYQ